MSDDERQAWAAGTSVEEVHAARTRRAQLIREGADGKALASRWRRAIAHEWATGAGGKRSRSANGGMGREGKRASGSGCTRATRRYFSAPRYGDRQRPETATGEPSQPSHCPVKGLRYCLGSRLPGHCSALCGYVPSVEGGPVCRVKRTTPCEANDFPALSLFAFPAASHLPTCATCSRPPLLLSRAARQLPRCSCYVLLLQRVSTTRRHCQASPLRMRDQDQTTFLIVHLI